MLGPPLLSAWDGLQRLRATLHGTPPAAFTHRAAYCKVRRAAPPKSPAPKEPRPQRNPALPHSFHPAGSASRSTSSFARPLRQTPLRLQPARSPCWAPPCPFLGPRGRSRLLRGETCTNWAQGPPGSCLSSGGSAGELLGGTHPAHQFHRRPCPLPGHQALDTQVLACGAPRVLRILSRIPGPRGWYIGRVIVGF